MAQCLDDLNLPISSITRIAKEVLPDNVAIGKEARTAMSKAACVFVLYVTSASYSIATKNNRKTINGNDVLQAMEKTDFLMFLEPLKENLEYFKKTQLVKKDAVMKRKHEKDGKDSSATNTTDEIQVEEEGDVGDED